jgi:hypothetical protein
MRTEGDHLGAVVKPSRRAGTLARDALPTKPNSVAG